VNGDSIEVKFNSKTLGGFFSEVVPAFGTTTQGVFNLIRSRVPDAVFNGIVYHHAPPPPPPQSNNTPHRPW